GSDHGLTLERRPEYAGRRPGNVARVEYARSPVSDALEPYARDDLDMVAVRYTPRLADLLPGEATDAHIGPAAWSGYLAFDHRSEPTSNVDLRRALAHAVDRHRLASALPVNMLLATGGIVPPALQGHTPDIALRFDPDLAREPLARSGFSGALAVAGLDDHASMFDP